MCGFREGHDVLILMQCILHRGGGKDREVPQSNTVSTKRK